ncbi:hypothetical protein BKA62DRAFT_685590 [Auriculariales sp. MPI-PUGE-AT-0066]|nr:hypothetical protein BKA62DRAFT_685590 [Auriculariales sp. MPI-PUGE-AT-0066]
MSQQDTPSAVSFPSNDRSVGSGTATSRSAAVRPRSPTDAASTSTKAAQRSLGTGFPRHGSRSTSFAIIEAPHMSSIPSPLNPNTNAPRKRTQTHSVVPSRKGKEPDMSGFTADTFGALGGAQIRHSDLQREINKLQAQGTSVRSKSKSATMLSPASPRTPVTTTPPRSNRTLDTRRTGSPATPPRSATSSLKSPISSPSRRPTLPATPVVHQSSEALVLHEQDITPHPSSSSLCFDWSNLPEDPPEKKHRRKLLSFSARRPKKDHQTGSDTGDDADAVEASLKAVRDHASPTTYRRRDALKQEFEARYSILSQFMANEKRGLNLAEIVKWRRQNALPGPLRGIGSTSSLPSFAAAASDPNILMTLDNDPRHKYRLTAAIIQEWFNTEVIPPLAAAELVISSSIGSNSTVRSSIPITRKRGANEPNSPVMSHKRLHRQSQPIISMESLKGIVQSAAPRRETADSNSSLSKVKRALRLDSTSRPSSAGNSEEESAASTHRKANISRPTTPELPHRADSGTDDDARSGRSLGQIARKGFGTLLGMAYRDDPRRNPEMSPSLLSPMTSTDAMSKTLDVPSTAQPRSPYLHIKEWQPRNTSRRNSRTSGDHLRDQLMLRMRDAKERELKLYMRERKQTKAFLSNVANSLRDYKQLQAQYRDILGVTSGVLDDTIFNAIDVDPYDPPPAAKDNSTAFQIRSEPKQLATHRASEDLQLRLDRHKSFTSRLLNSSTACYNLVPSHQLENDLVALLTSVKDLQSEQRQLAVSAQKLQDLQPRVDALWQELVLEVGEVEMVVACSYGIKTRTTALANSRIHSIFGVVAEFILTRVMTLFRHVRWYWKVFLPGALVFTIALVIWMQWSVFGVLLNLVIATLAAVVVVFMVMFFRFVWYSGFTGSVSLAS